MTTRFAEGGMHDSTLFVDKFIGSTRSGVQCKKSKGREINEIKKTLKQKYISNYSFQCFKCTLW